MLDAVLLDLDGTLLPMDTDYFVEVYFKYLFEDAYAWGYTDSALLEKGVRTGLKAMYKNDGSVTCSAAFWKAFSEVVHKDPTDDVKKFETFYATNFNKAKFVAKENPYVQETLEVARKKAKYVILATNPIFPKVANDSRMAWIGVKESDFDMVTDFDSCYFCKPNPMYYKQEILDKIGLDPEKCIMIGNDFDEDILATRKLGMPSYLVTDFMINRQNKEIDCPHGTYAEMVDYLKNL